MTYFVYLVCHLVTVCFFFFFQAEDGIRDVAVTGVQTCALPILVQLYFSARSQSCGSGAMSPSIEKTPSVIISFFPGKLACSCRMRSQSSTSLCLKILMVAFESRAPSMIEA